MKIRGKKCIVRGCGNFEGQGGFAGPLCSPCENMLRTGVIGCGTTFLHEMRDQLETARGLIRYVVDKSAGTL